MTLEKLKERIEATCNKNGFEIKSLSVQLVNDDILCSFKIIKGDAYVHFLPNADLLLEKIDLDCRIIKAIQSSATNGIDE